MYSDWGWLLWIAVFIWLGILSFWIWQSSQYAKTNKKILKSVFEGGDEDTAVKFEQLIRKVKGIDSELTGIKDDIKEILGADLRHTQRVELLRFNPYEDTGGDQSFTVALLDKDGNGVVITSLHSRAATRVFAKPVVLGRPEKYEFSKEETEVVKKAMGR